MAFEISIVDDQVFALDPAVITQALLPHFGDCQILGVVKGADPARHPLRPRTPWRNEQCRNSDYELPPLHSVLSSQLEETGCRLSGLNGRRTKRDSKAASQALRDGPCPLGVTSGCRGPRGLSPVY